jgi:hypothetical protein
MSITDQNPQATVRASESGPAVNGAPRRAEIVRPTLRETKPSPRTTELWITIVGVAVLALVYNASRDSSLNLFRACLLGTLMAAAYVVSRGLAKAGSHDDDRRVDEYDRRIA